MTLFGNEDALDLSDQGLLARLLQQEEPLPPETADPEQQGQPDPEQLTLRPTPETLNDPGATPDPAAQEQLWEQAQQQVLQLWPQAQGDMESLVRLMTEISQEYGDGQLWQRDPVGMLRHAAMELYGPPSQNLEQVVQAALLAGQQEQARREKEQQRRLTLAPSGLRQSRPAPLSPDQEIIRAMAQSRRNGIF